MTLPPLYHLQDLGTQARQMSRKCQNPRVAIVLEYVSLGSMIVMTGVVANARDDDFLLAVLEDDPKIASRNLDFMDSVNLTSRFGCCNNHTGGQLLTQQSVHDGLALVGAIVPLIAL